VTSLLVDIWCVFPDVFSNEKDVKSELLGQKCLNSIKRVVRNSTTTFKLTQVSLMFQLLEELSQVRDMFAPIVYKLLVF